MDVLGKRKKERKTGAEVDRQIQAHLRQKGKGGATLGCLGACLTHRDSITLDGG